MVPVMVMPVVAVRAMHMTVVVVVMITVGTVHMLMRGRRLGRISHRRTLGQLSVAYPA